ncbi:putative prephenate dehydratase [Rosellinia necatrix]|uniref:prephenate dehydratase n=1 Tax=Rosellinia necatrix TaxID=77044 RepID=A0A1W2TLP1_ROSNE|nr:putative prephenate dehydratase [Rosellinia necatrix]
METAEQASPGSAGPKPVVCFLGPISSYTHQATMETFPAGQFDLMPVSTIKDIFDTTQSGVATYGVVPFENSTNGSVVFTLDYFADRSGEYGDLNVCQEIYLDVHHCLLGHIAPPRQPPPLSSTAAAATANPATIAAATAADREAGSTSGQRTPTAQHPHPAAARSRPLHPLTHVRRVYSHPQAFGQCAAFLASWLRGVETVDVSSTSRAAELALTDPTGESAAISSAVAAELMGLDVLARNIEDREDNTTRFFVLRKGGRAQNHHHAPKTGTEPEPEPEPEPETGGDSEARLLSSTKSLLSFTVPHRSPGALADVLSCFRRGGLNLTSINSRPSLAGAVAFEYIFFVEFEGHRFQDPRGRVAAVLNDVAAVARTSRWLGSWENMRATVE